MTATLSAGHALGMSAAVVAGEAALPGLGGLAGIREEVVLARSIVGGNRLEVTRFVDPRSAEVLLQEVLDRWSQRPAPVHRSVRDGWQTLMQLDGSSLETLEVRATDEGVEGRRSRLHKGDGGEREASAWLLSVLPAGSRVVDRVAHADGGRRMTTVVAVTMAGLAVAAAEISKALKRNGFSSGAHPSDAAVGAGIPGKVLFFVRAAEDLAVTITDHAGERAVVMHWGRTTR